MHRALPLSLIACLALGGCAAEVPLPPPQRKVMLGQEATDLDQIEATVALIDGDGEFFCSGTLIAPNLVMTAGHCAFTEDMIGNPTVAREPHDIIVVAGALDVAEAAFGQRHYVSVIRVHEGFGELRNADVDGLGQWDDIALLLLNGSIDTMEPIPILPVTRLDAPLVPTLPVDMAGYGATDPDPALAELGVLHVGQTPFVRRSYHELLTGGSGVGDYCPGDSGGPIYVTVDEQRYVIGVVSRGINGTEALCGEGTISTLAPRYISWIEGASGGRYTPVDKEPVACSNAGTSSGLTWLLLGWLWLWRRRRRSA